MGTEDAIVFTTGYQSNLGAISALLEPGDTVICDSGDHASILDGCKLSGARLRPFRHNRMDKLESMLKRAQEDRRRPWSWSTASSRWRATSATCPRSLELCQALRRAADGRRGPRRRRSRRARCGRLRAVRARGPGRPAHGHLLQEPRLLRRLHRRLRGGGRVPEDLLARLHLQRLGGAGGDRSRARRPAGDAPGGPGAVREAARQRELPARGLPRASASRWSSPGRFRTAVRPTLRSSR